MRATNTWAHHTAVVQCLPSSRYGAFEACYLSSTFSSTPGTKPDVRMAMQPGQSASNISVSLLWLSASLTHAKLGSASATPWRSSRHLHTNIAHIMLKSQMSVSPSRGVKEGESRQMLTSDPWYCMCCRLLPPHLQHSRESGRSVIQRTACLLVEILQGLAICIAPHVDSIDFVYFRADWSIFA